MVPEITAGRPHQLRSALAGGCASTRVGTATPSMQRNGVPADLPHGSATILVVEDEAGVREIAVAILRSLGYRVLEASDGDEGLRAFGVHTADIDMLLTDVVLPGKVRGRELAERITAIRPEVKVLFMSGYTENSVVHHGRLDDGVQLLGKPFKREQLARKVAEILGATSVPGANDADNVVDLRARKRDKSMIALSGQRFVGASQAGVTRGERSSVSIMP